MKFILTSLYIIVFSCEVFGQLLLPEKNISSVKDELIPGIYLSFEDFKNNSPIKIDEIQTDIDPDNQDFFFLLFKQKNITVKLKDAPESEKSLKAWGYFDGHEVYIHESNFRRMFRETEINSEHPFAQINILGTISFINYMNKGSQYSHSSGFTKRGRKVPLEFLLDTRSGEIYPASHYNLEKMIEDDPELLSEYSKYRGDSDIQFFMFLKQYNRLHPLTF